MRESVIVPVYNVADYLDECLRSVIEDADSDVELVCVDDGSTDSSGKMLDMAVQHVGASGCTIKVIHQGNAGTGAARNAGLASATGDWIMFLDGDDVLAKGWLSLVRTMAARHASSEMLGFGCADTLPIGSVVEGFASREVDVSKVVGYDVYARGMWQYAYRRDIVEGLEFERMVRGEDKLFQGAAILRARRVAMTDVNVYGYRQRDGSVVNSAWNMEKFSAELAWRDKWLRAMDAAGKTMDRALWRYMGLHLLEYIPHWLADTADLSLRSELEGLWFDTLHSAAAFAFAPWQRLVMRTLAATRSSALAWLLCRLPYAAKHLVHFGTLG